MTAISMNPTQVYMHMSGEIVEEKKHLKSTNKSLSVASGVFRLICSFLTIGGGVRGLAAKAVDSKTEIVDKTKNVFVRTFEKAKRFVLETHYNSIFGSLYLTSGTCAAISSFHDLNVYNLGPALGIINGVELGTYLAASLMALYTHVKAFQNACILPANPTAEQIEESKRKKISAILGIISAVSYILNIALLFMGQLAALAFILGLLGTLVGFVKVLYDYFNPVPIPIPARV